MKRSPIKPRRRTKHQIANVDHAEYVRWVHTQPCASCGTMQNIQAAHVGQGGMGMKHGSDAEVIPLCGPRRMLSDHGTRMVQGCHADHDQYAGSFRIGLNWSSRAAIREWDEIQIAAYRGRFEARSVTSEGIPF